MKSLSCGITPDVRRATRARQASGAAGAQHSTLKKLAGL